MAEYIEKWSVVNRLIDIENEFQRHKPFHGFEHAMYRKICEAEIAIGKTQAADVAPVRHGRWELTGADKYGRGGIWKCTGRDGCGKFYPYKCDFCPNCGAKMGGGADNGT